MKKVNDKNSDNIKKNKKGSKFLMFSRFRDFFLSPEKFFKEVKSESFFSAFKNYILFLVLFLGLNILVYSLFSGFSLSFFSVLIVMVFFSVIYFLIPVLLRTSLSIMKVKEKGLFLKVFNLNAYVLTYLSMVTSVFSFLFSVVKNLFSSLYVNLYVDIFFKYIFVINLIAFGFYYSLGFKEVFEMRYSKVFWTFLVFSLIILLFYLVGISVLITRGVSA